MAEKWEAIGLYAYRSYTKVDVWEEEKEDNINSTAIHEFVHSYITKASDYGRYLIAILSVLKNHKNCYCFCKKDKNNYMKKIWKLEKIFLSLNDNMKEMQECLAYLIETLYICETKGFEEGKQYLKKIEKQFNSIKSYEHIIDQKYLYDICKSYMEYLKINNINKHSLLQKSSSKNLKIFIGINYLIDIGIAALNIGQFNCPKTVWTYPNAFTNSVIVNKKYNPNKRFRNLSRELLPLDCKAIDFSLLDIYTINCHSEEIKEEILNIINCYTDKKTNFMAYGSDKIIVNEEIFNVSVVIDTMERFVTMAYLTAIPAILCINSADKFIQYKTSCAMRNKPKSTNSALKTFLEISDTICINVPPGFETKKSCIYEVRIDLDFLENKWNLSSKINILEADTSVTFMIQEDELFKLLYKFGKSKTIFLTGNYHLYSLIYTLKKMNKKHYVFLANNMSLLLEFIRNTTSDANTAKPNAMFLEINDIKNILIIRSEESIMFQPMINQYIENVKGEYGFRFSKENIISGKDKAVISRILRWHYGNEAEYIKRIGDAFF